MRWSFHAKKIFLVIICICLLWSFYIIVSYIEPSTTYSKSNTSKYVKGKEKLDEKTVFNIKDTESNYIHIPESAIPKTNDDKIINSNENKGVLVTPRKNNFTISTKKNLKVDFGSPELNVEREVNISDLIVLKNENERFEYNEGIENYQFNALVSKRIGYRRKIKDSRDSQCNDLKYSKDLDPASIIICYFNEEPYTLIRMVNSILDRTPDNLIHEILLVDDSSTLAERHPELIERYKEKFWPSKVKMIKTPKNEGLIRAKVFGSRQATGKNLVFLDSHCEVNQKWLEPLLERIKDDPKKVVCPIIDIIKHENLEYIASPVCMGGFTWALTFKWDYPDNNYLNIPENRIKPLKSPTMAGGLFAINKETFTTMGEYDLGMDIWGAENVEMSFRIWMCGYELEIIPCSRVGHIFRDKRPYSTDVDSMGKNSLRTALIWLDTYKDYFFKSRPYLKDMKEEEYGNLSRMVNLRKELNCKNFEWYLKNIYPQIDPMNVINDTEIYSAKKLWINEEKYKIKLKNSDLCLTAESTESGRISIKSKLTLEECKKSSRRQNWKMSKTGELRNLGAPTLCLDTYSGLSLLKCHNQGLSQEWIYVREQLYVSSSRKCLHIDKKESQYANIEYCSKSNKWELDVLN